MRLGQRWIGDGHPVYVIAELSANHNQDYREAERLVQAAAESGADAVKLQTYTPDTMTIESNREWFQIGKGTIWEGKNLYQLYGEAYTPWEWQPKLMKLANDLGMDLFSTPFDASAVEFLEAMEVPAYKVASFENGDIPLLRRVAATGRPVIMSNGMATLGEIDEAERTLRAAGSGPIALLKCTSAYPAPAEEMHLRTIPHLAEAFDTPVGLSDHTLGSAVAIAGVAVGACIVEKHFTLSREVPGPDSQFSMEPREFREMVDAIRVTEKALGRVCHEVTSREEASRVFRRSLFVVRDMAPGETFTAENVRCIRPGYGLHPRFQDEVMGRRAVRAIERGTPLSWDLVGAGNSDTAGSKA